MNKTVEKVIGIWNQFCFSNGGKDNLSLNIIMKWPGYLKEHYCDKEKLLSLGKTINLFGHKLRVTEVTGEDNIFTLNCRPDCCHFPNGLKIQCNEESFKDLLEETE